MRRTLLLVMGCFVCLAMLVCEQNGEAKSSLPIKAGIYVLGKDKCSEADEFPVLNVSEKKDGGVYSFNWPAIHQFIVRSVNKKDNIYHILVDFQPVTGAMAYKTMYKETWVIEVANETSFTLLEAPTLEIQGDNKETYKYCTQETIENKAETNNHKSAAFNSVGNLSTPDSKNKIVGTWRGVFHAKNSNGKPYTVDCEYVITQDKNNPDNYYFKQIDTLTFLDSTDTFSCSSKNSYSNSFDGQIVVHQENLKFIQKTVSNPRCGSLGTDYFRIAGDHLEVVNFNDGKVTTGILNKQ